MTMKAEIAAEALQRIGGRLWEKHGHRRIYFNEPDMMETIGLEVSRYNSGRISSARHDGCTISNREANRIIARLPKKLWYDLNVQKWAWVVKDHNRRRPYRDEADEMAEEVIAAIEGMVAGDPEAADDPEAVS